MKIALIGDMAFYGKFCLANNSNIYQYFEKIANVLNKYDHVVGNLESPFVENGNPFGAKSAYLKADPCNVRLLEYLNVKTVNLANNHIFDYGLAGYHLTKKVLSENCIRYFGIENSQTTIEDSDNKIAISGYCCYSTNPQGIYSERGYGINPFDVSEVEANLIMNEKLGYYSIVSVHTGQEHVNYPSWDTIRCARRFAKIAPYVFYGHHPHVVQGIERIEESLICYSLGNFCFDDVYSSVSKRPLVIQSDNNRSSYILDLEFHNNRLISHAVIPIFAGNLEIEVGSDDVMKKITQCSDFLNQDKTQYNSTRNEDINSYLSSRKKQRNFAWLIKRCRPRYASIWIRSMLNKSKYHKCVTAQLGGAAE